jgi:hypothetical protein
VITNGDVRDATFPANRGGGIVNQGALTLNDVTVTRNRAADGGGIASYNGGSVELTDSIVSANSATYEGGGIDIHTATLTVTNSTVSNNVVTGDGSLAHENNGGGGIYALGGSATIRHSQVIGNTAGDPAHPQYGEGGWIYGEGGGILNVAGLMTLDNSTVTGNTAASGQGGGVFNLGGTMTQTGVNVLSPNTPDDGCFGC